MHRIEQVFTRRIAMSHRLVYDPKSPCFSVHGHNLFIKWHVIHRFSTNFTFDFHQNMLEPFAKVKSQVHEWMDKHLDHAHYISDKDPRLSQYYEDQPNSLVVLPGDPTMEMLGACIFSKINAFLAGTKLACHTVQLDETPTNTVIVRSRFNLPTEKAHWWNRADNSICDLHTKDWQPTEVVEVKDDSTS